MKSDCSQNDVRNKSECCLTIFGHWRSLDVDSDPRPVKIKRLCGMEWMDLDGYHSSYIYHICILRAHSVLIMIIVLVMNEAIE